MSPTLIQILMALATAALTGLTAYHAAQKGVAVAQAKIENDILWIKAQQAEHRKEDDDNFREHSGRILALERVTSTRQRS